MMRTLWLAVNPQKGDEVPPTGGKPLPKRFVRKLNKEEQKVAEKILKNTNGKSSRKPSRAKSKHK